MSQSEDKFERENVLEWLSSNNWEVKYGDNEPFIGTRYDREEDEVIYWDTLEKKIKEINNIDEDEYEYIESDLKKDLTHGESLLNSNKEAIERLRSGGSYTYNNESKSYKVLDFDDVDENDFVAVNQFVFADDDPYRNRRPDIVLFINGIPVCVIELKSISSGNTTVEAIDQIANTYENEIPELFVPNVYNIVLNQDKIRYGAVGANNEHYHYWKDNNKEIISEVKSHLKDLTEPTRILEILNDYTFFKQIPDEQEYAKIIPRHQQYFSTKKIIKDVSKSENNNDLGKHLIVHVQGSGKSYAMMYAANILSRRHDYPVYIIVDESELVKQFGNELEKIEEISETVIRSDQGSRSGSHQLKKVIESGESGVILSILHLFNELDDDVQLDEKPVVLADEAHRFLGDILGSEMESTLEPFHYYGYTGTPIEETYEMFSDEEDLYLHRYSMADGVEEDAVLPVNMVSKKDKIKWIVDEERMDEEFEEEFSHLPEDEKRQVIYDAMSTQKIAGIETRMDLIADDIVEHFTTELRNEGINYKAMVVTKGKENAAKYGTKLQQELGSDSVDVIYSSSNTDSDIVQKFHKDDEEMDDVIENFKETTNPKILVVCEMLRTGFDAPILKTIYLDRRFSGGHTLLQTIARTNRPLTVEQGETEETSEKMYGEIIDYQGITEKFDDLVEYDDEEIEKFTSEDKEKFKDKFKEKLEKLDSYFTQKFIDENKHEKKNWTADLSSIDIQKDFMRDFSKLRNLYQNIKPDPFIQAYDEKYNWYEGIYDSVRTHRNEIEEEVEDGMIDVVRSNVSVSEKEEYERKERVVDGVEDNISPLTVTKRKETLEEILRLNEKFDPRYEKLSKRVEDIIESWNQDIISDEDALDKLDTIREESDDIRSEINNSDLGESEYMVKSVILKSIDTKEDDDLNQLVEGLVEEYNDTKPSIDKWWKSEDKLDIVRSSIDDYFYSCDRMELAVESEVTSEILKKLISVDRRE